MAKQIAIADLKEKSLDSRITSYWGNRDKSSRLGLELLDVCIRRAASESRDWDGLARFYSNALKVNQATTIRKIIQAAFGGNLKWKTDANHPAGGVFVFGWKGAFPLAGSNTYSVVTSAIASNMGWDHKVFVAKLNEILPKVETKRVASEESLKKVVKHLMSYTDKLSADGFNVGQVLALLQKELAAQAVDKKVAVPVVSGLEG